MLTLSELNTELFTLLDSVLTETPIEISFDHKPFRTWDRELRRGGITRLPRPHKWLGAIHYSWDNGQKANFLPVSANLGNIEEVVRFLNLLTTCPQNFTRKDIPVRIWREIARIDGSLISWND